MPGMADSASQSIGFKLNQNNRVASSKKSLYPVNQNSFIYSHVGHALNQHEKLSEIDKIFRIYNGDVRVKTVIIGTKEVTIY